MLIENVAFPVVGPAAVSPSERFAWDQGGAITPTLQYDFINNPSLTGHPLAPDLSITRATKATMVDADGYIREVQAGEARFTGATHRENNFKVSDDLTGVGWADAAVTSTANALANPLNGSVDATLVTNDGTAAQHYVVGTNPWDAGGGTSKYITSFYAKAGTAGFVHLLQTVDNVYAQWDLSDGSVANSSGTDEAVTAGTDVGGGWYRFHIVHTPTSIGADPRFYFLDSAVATPAPSETSSSTGYLYGPMAERAYQNTTPSSYLENTTNAIISSLTGTSTKGLLVEEARTNLALNSEDFSGVNWGSSDFGTISTNTATAPDGSTTMDTLVDDGLGGSGSVSIRQLYNLSTTTQYAFSVFAKANGNSWILINMESFTGVTAGKWFNLGTGALGSSNGTPDANYIEDFGNGIYRCTVVFTTAADASGYSRIYVADEDSDSVVARDGTSSVFVWGAQLEAGAFPTSYIPTTTASVTRNADTDIESSDVSWLNKTEGTMYVKLNKSNNTADAVGFDVGAATDRLLGCFITGGNFDFLSRTSTGTDGDINGSAVTVAADTDYRWVGGYANNDMAQYINGTADGTETSVTHPASGAISVFNIGHSFSNTAPMNGHISEIRYYNTRLTNAQLESLSLTGTL